MRCPGARLDHPKVFYLNERVLLEAVCRFYIDRVFGPDRQALLAADLASAGDHAARQRQEERDRLERHLADLDRRQAAVLRQTQAVADDPFTSALRRTYNELEQNKNTARTELSAIDDMRSSRSGRAPTPRCSMRCPRCD